MATKEAIKKRRNKIEKMMAEGMSKQKIRKELDISNGTLYRDIEYIQRKNKDMDGWDSLEEIKGALSHMDSIEEEAWNTYLKASEGSNQAIGALNTLIRTRKEKIKLLMDTGYIEKVPEEFKHSYETFEETVKRLRDERGLDN